MKTIKEILKMVISSIISIVVTFAVFINVGDKTLADFGFTKWQLRTAYNYQISQNFSAAFELYKKVYDKNDKNKPLVALKMGTICSEKFENKDYQQAWEYYKEAMKSDDVNVLKLCLKFVVQQNKLFNENPANEDIVNILSDENIELITKLLNNIYEVDNNISNVLSVHFPISEEKTADVFSLGKEWVITTFRWEYVSTRTSHNGGEAFTNDDEKLVFVGSWQELTSPEAFTTVTVYKYYRYKKVIDPQTKASFFDVTKSYLSDIKEITFE